MSDGYLVGKPPNLHCEAMMLVTVDSPVRAECSRPASFIYGPECEATTGRLMYLCDEHAQQIKDWIPQHLYDPVDCKTHGTIGIVKDYLVLKEI